MVGEMRTEFSRVKGQARISSVLTIPNGSEGFEIYIDASELGLGCILMQYGKVIAYTSR